MKIITLIKMRKILNNIVFFSINTTAVILLLFYMTFIINHKDRIIMNLEITKDSLDVVKDSLDKEIIQLNYKLTKFKVDSVNMESLNQHF